MIKGEAVVKIHGWPGLSRLDPGTYRIKNMGDGTYTFYTTLFRCPIVRILIRMVDPWFKHYGPRIEVLA